MSYLGKIGDRNSRNAKIFLKCGCKVGAGLGLVVCLLACPFGVCVRLFEDSGPTEMPALVLWWCVPCFYPLCCSACGALHLNMALFRVLRAFLERFMGLVWVCVGWVVCVDCVAFVRVWS